MTAFKALDLRKYVYDTKGTIIRDTTYSMGLLGQSNSIGLVNFYTYDNLGRIIKVKYHHINFTNLHERTYNYDNRANLIRDEVAYNMIAW